jgi:hypothetical protein
MLSHTIHAAKADGSAAYTWLGISFVYRRDNSRLPTYLQIPAKDYARLTFHTSSI